MIKYIYSIFQDNITKKELDNLKNENKVLKSLINKLEEKFEDHLDEYRSDLVTDEELNDEIEYLKTENDDNIKYLEEEYDEKIKCLSDEIKDLNDKIKDLKECIDEHVVWYGEFDDLKKVIERQRWENEELIEELNNELDSKIEDLKEKYRDEHIEHKYKRLSILDEEYVEYKVILLKGDIIKDEIDYDGDIDN
jgi:predicted  nucleic acid-binding Zn-ribbon protein